MQCQKSTQKRTWRPSGACHPPRLLLCRLPVEVILRSVAGWGGKSGEMGLANRGREGLAQGLQFEGRQVGLSVLLSWDGARAGGEEKEVCQSAVTAAA